MILFFTIDAIVLEKCELGYSEHGLAQPATEQGISQVGC